MSMEKNRIRPVTSGKNSRMSYSKGKDVLEMPNLIEVQKDSYEWFLKDGLKEVLDDISPIEDFAGHVVTRQFCALRCRKTDVPKPFII